MEQVLEQLNAIGLDTQKSEGLARNLNELLANYSIFYQNVRGFHWNIKGDKFFELHAKFEELYTHLYQKIDEVAERIRTVGYTPYHRYSSYVKIAEIKEQGETSIYSQAIQNILDSFKTILIKQREILRDCSEVEDEGTYTFISDIIKEQEKIVWMYSAYLSRK